MPERPSAHGKLDLMANNQSELPPVLPADLDGDGDANFRDAAIQAEFRSGRREETAEKAWHHALFRMGRMTVGFITFIVGIIMLPAPGPGGLVIATGLAILARDVAWADRLLRYLRRKMPGMAEEGPVPARTIIISLMIMVAAFLSLLWAKDQSWWPPWSGLF